MDKNLTPSEDIAQKYNSLFFKLIELTVDELKFKFNDSNILPIIHTTEIIRYANEKSLHTLRGLKMYNDIINFEQLYREIQCWRVLKKQSSFLETCKQTCQREFENNSQYTIQEIFHAFEKLCLSLSLPQLDMLFRIYLAIPVSMVRNQNEFSVLKRIKIWLRNTMGHRRKQCIDMNMCLLNVERDLLDSVDKDLILSEFYKRKDDRFFQE